MMMKRFFIILVCFYFGSFAAFGQDKIVYIPKDLNPIFLYISKYSPEYYYENHHIGEYFGSGNLPFELEIRIYRNFKDDKTFTCILLTGIVSQESATLFTWEIDSLISFLKRCYESIDRKTEGNVHYCYNSDCGIFFKYGKPRVNGREKPWCQLNVLLPKGTHLEMDEKRKLDVFIQKLEDAKSYIPAKETDFLYQEELAPKDDWEMKEVKGNGEEMYLTVACQEVRDASI